MDLPEIFKNKINEDLNNNKKTYRSTKNDESLDLILKNIPVTAYIETNNKELTTTIIGRTQNYIVTKGRDVIYIKDIKTIKKI